MQSFHFNIDLFPFVTSVFLFLYIVYIVLDRDSMILKNILYLN